MVEERERACDEEVLGMRYQPRAYADAILRICKLSVESPLACVAGVAGASLKRRIVAIMSNDPLTGYGEASPGNLRTGCMLLVDSDKTGLIQRAYVRFAEGRLHRFGILPIKGGPAWIHSDPYEIKAKAQGPASPAMMQGPMLQALLQDRFQLRIHRETREGPVYALTPAKSSARLKPFIEGSCSQMPLAALPPPEPASGQRYCRSMITLPGPAGAAVDGEGLTISEFSKLLDVILDRPVVDQTGIAGKFNIHLEFSPDQAVPTLRRPGSEEPAADTNLGRPPILTAIQQQLGLKLLPSTGPVESLVIDHIERPSEN
jgi:bla regulator protein BlaR1